MIFRVVGKGRKFCQSRSVFWNHGYQLVPVGIRQPCAGQ